VDFVLRQSVPESVSELAPVNPVWTFLVAQWMRLSDSVSWIQVALRLDSFGARMKGMARRWLAGVSSEEAVVTVLRRFRQGGEK
jgi:hypothetical protein